MFLHIMQLAHISFRNAPLPFIFSLRTDSHLPPSAVCYPLCFQFPSQIPSSEIISPLMAQSHATSSSHTQPLSFSVPQNPSLQSGSFLPHAYSFSPRCAATRAMTFTLFLPLINGKPELSHLISSFWGANRDYTLDMEPDTYKAGSLWRASSLAAPRSMTAVALGFSLSAWFKNLVTSAKTPEYLRKLSSP